MKTYEIEGTKVEGILADVAEAYQDEDGNLSLVLETPEMATFVANNLNQENDTDEWFVCSWIDGTDRQVCFQ